MKIIGRHAIDPDLNVIAKRLGTLQWQTELSPLEEDTCNELQRNPDASRRLVSPMPDFTTWAVRMYLGGAQRTLGLLRGPDLQNAFRFADMVKMYFWKYKLRGAHEPTDGELNLSVERAKLDMVGEPDALQMLKDIEAHLLKLGALTTGADQEKQRQDRRADNSRRRTISGTFEEMMGLWRTRIQEVQDKYAALDTTVKRLSEVVDSLFAGLQAQTENIKRLTEEVKNLAVCVNAVPYFPTTPCPQPNITPMQPGWPYHPGPGTLPPNWTGAPYATYTTSSPLPASPGLCGGSDARGVS